ADKFDRNGNACLKSVILGNRREYFRSNKPIQNIECSEDSKIPVDEIDPETGRALYGSGLVLEIDAKAYSHPSPELVSQVLVHLGSRGPESEGTHYAVNVDS